MKELLEKITWLGCAGFLIKDKLTIYIDPIGLADGLPKADIVFLTHSHDAHCSKADVEKISTPQTIVVGPKDCVSRFRLNQLPMLPGETKRILGLEATAIASYNAKEDTVHPSRHNWLGFVLKTAGGNIYHTGDATWVPEMETVRADVLLFPVEGRDAFGADDERRCLETVKPKAVVPMHFDPPGDAARLERLSRECARLGIGFHRLELSAV